MTSGWVDRIVGRVFRIPGDSDEEALLARAAAGDEAAARLLASKDDARLSHLRGLAATSWWARLQYRRQLDDKIRALASLQRSMLAEEADPEALESLGKNILDLRVEASDMGSLEGARPLTSRERMLATARRSIEDGIEQGWFFAKAYSLVAALPLVGLLVLGLFKRDYTSLKYILVVPAYFLGFGSAGAVAGALSPFMGRFRLGRMLIGFLAAIPASLMFTLITINVSDTPGSIISTSLGAAAVIGPLLALVMEAT